MGEHNPVRKKVATTKRKLRKAQKKQESKYLQKVKSASEYGELIRAESTDSEHCDRPPL